MSCKSGERNVPLLAAVLMTRLLITFLENAVLDVVRLITNLAKSFC